MNHISVAELAWWQQHEFDFTLLDVRRAQAREHDASTIAGALWRDPAAWLDWKDEWRASPRPVVLVCVHGQEISQGLAAALRAMGIDARHLRGGMQQWRESGHALVAHARAPTST
jgi:rhodanese-related sulfurtransferase